MREETLSPQTAEQFRYIELMLLYEGVLTNQALRKRFNVSQVQASRIIKKYRDENPGHMERLAGRGSYRIGSKLSLGETPHPVGDYFNEEGISIEYPCVATAQNDLTQTSPTVVRQLVQANIKGCGVTVTYSSMSHPQGKERLIFPHAFAFGGSRWHVRAFDVLNGEYRDFNLGRIESAAIEMGHSPPAVVDEDWETFVELTIGPHPGLSLDQQRMIRREYFGGTAGRIVTVRKAIEMYSVRHLEVATDTRNQLPPEFLLAVLRRSITGQPADHRHGA